MSTNKDDHSCVRSIWECRIERYSRKRQKLGRRHRRTPRTMLEALLPLPVGKLDNPPSDACNISRYLKSEWDSARNFEVNLERTRFEYEELSSHFSCVLLV